MLKSWKLVKYIQKIRAKKRDLDLYVKHVRSLEDAFQQITNASGISMLQDIVTAIIKTEDQKSELVKYIYQLTNSIDSEEDFRQFYLASLNALRQSTVYDKKSTRDTVNSLKKKFERMREVKERLDQEVNSLTYAITHLGVPIEVISISEITQTL